MNTPALRARGLSKHYGSAVGVEEIDLEVARGERMGLLGPNGAGKTTLIRLALGMLQPTAGAIEVEGRDVAEERLAALAEVGYLPGELGLYRHLTGGRMLDMLARLHPRAPRLREELLDVVALDRADLARPVREYSRGMKQKVGIVSALQHDPPTAILDEPTGGLDPVVQDDLMEWLAGWALTGRTVIFSSHVLGEVERLCDRVAMIRDGRLLVTEDVAELRAHQVRRVSVRFSGAVDPGAYRVAGMSEVSVAGSDHEFTLDGAVPALLARLRDLPLTDLLIREPRLEDLFREYYSGGRP